MLKAVTLPHSDVVKRFNNLKKNLWQLVKQVIETINSMPEEEFNDLMVCVNGLFFAKIKRTERDIAEGRGYTPTNKNLSLQKMIL